MRVRAKVRGPWAQTSPVVIAKPRSRLGNISTRTGPTNIVEAFASVCLYSNPATRAQRVQKRPRATIERRTKRESMPDILKTILVEAHCGKRHAPAGLSHLHVSYGGRKKTEVHQRDYDKAHDVSWLCRQHHVDVLKSRIELLFAGEPVFPAVTRKTLRTRGGYNQRQEVQS